MNNKLKEPILNDLVYVGNTAIYTNKLLWRELPLKMKGLGFLNVLKLLISVGVKPEETRTVTYNTLSEDCKQNLQETLLENKVELDNKDIYFANLKKRNLSEEFSSESGNDSKNYVLIENALLSSKNIDIKRLVKMNSYVGSRHAKGYKVHGQRTKSTGRKNKTAKGFIKKKLAKKEERLNQKKKNSINE